MRFMETFGLTREELEKIKEKLERDPRIHHVTLKMEDSKNPLIIDFGESPYDKNSSIHMNVYLYKSDNNNKCVVFCAVVKGTLISIEFPIPHHFLNDFLNSETITFAFCERIKEIRDNQVVCTAEAIIRTENTLKKDKERIKQIIEEMKEPGDEIEAFMEYTRIAKLPLCFLEI